MLRFSSFFTTIKWNFQTEKISYYYQAIYIVGCTLTLVYAAALRLWPVYIPITLELTLIISLTVMKVIFDRREKKEKQELLKNNEEEDIDEEHGVIRKDNDGEDDNSSKDEVITPVWWQLATSACSIFSTIEEIIDHTLR